MKNRDIMNDLLPEDDFFIADAAPDAAKATKMKKVPSPVSSLPPPALCLSSAPARGHMPQPLNTATTARRWNFSTKTGFPPKDLRAAR